MINVKIKNKYLCIDEKIIEFKFNITDLAQNSDKLFIRTDGNEFDNVYCLFNDGTIKWRIDSSQFPELIPAYYMNIALINNKLKAFNFGGYDCTVDLETGKVIECEFVK